MTKAEKTRRIYLEKDQTVLSEEQADNLFWVREGRAYIFWGCITSELSARIYHSIEQLMPLYEVGEPFEVANLEGAEECILIENDQLISVRQVGEVKIGNVRLLINRL